MASPNPFLRWIVRPGPSRFLRPRIRHYSSARPEPRPPPAPAQAQPANNPQSRFDRLVTRLPKFTHKHVLSIRHQPLTHISAFLLLHELTAVVPLFGLAGLFHYTDWLPPWFAEGYYVKLGVERFGSWMRKKGWIADADVEEARRLEEGDGKEKGGRLERWGKTRDKWWGRGEVGTRWLVEFATAYAIVKAVLIPRVVFSAWATPWFARWTVVPLTRGVKRLFGRG